MIKRLYDQTVRPAGFPIGALFAASVALTASVQAAEPASPSQLLEKGIYSEETKGDLQSAMKLYEQAVAEGKDTQSIAAQAQYRLGVVHYKQNQFTEANEAFEKLIKDFPGQTNLVALAQDYLAGAVSLLPVPWVDGEELVLDVKFPSGFRIGMGSYSASSGETNGQKVWNLSSQIFAGMRQSSRAQVLADSFKPLNSVWKHTLIGEADTTYIPGYAQGTLKGKDKPKDYKVALTGTVYDNEEAVELFRRLPLATNYSSTIHIFSGLGGGTVIPLKVEVTAMEKVTVPAGTFECYKVELSIRQTFWYSTDAHRYPVKFEAGGVVAELTEINQHKPGDLAHFKDATSGLALSGPAGWLFDRHEAEDPNDPTRIVVLDPNAAGLSMVLVQKLDGLKADQKASLRSFAEGQIAEGSKMAKDLKVRPDSWKEITVAGKPALSVRYDFTEAGEKKSGRGVYMMDDKNGYDFLAYAPEKDFETFNAQFGAIINSGKFE